ncbi:MAG TPA: hypothetical protein VGX95_16145 [Xanthobacteraceae bacterium]|jgi:hypothetical protein|nr:hypothetical protein [Xanthobacteraceae bacterium]
MFSRILWAALPGLVLALASVSQAAAHCFVGARFLPATLTTDDPCVADEMSLPTMMWSSANPSARENDVEADFSKRITENFGITVASTWTFVRPPANAATFGTSASGFQNLDTAFQYQVLKDAPHEFALLAGLVVEWGGTGAAGVGAPPWSTLQPTVYFGKGFGDLPDELGLIRAFAVTGQAGYQVPTTSFDLTNQVPIPQNMAYGGSLQFSFPYLKSNVIDLGLPDFINHLIPIVEASFLSPVANNAGNPWITTGTVNPGVIWVGSYFQVGVEAIIPINRASGTNIGAIAQLHFYLDDIFPNTIGRPLFGSAPAPQKPFGD